MKEMMMSRAALLLSVIILSSCFFGFAMAGSASGFCDSKCAVRCSKVGEHRRCLKYCGICCQKCHCVPSGTFGHKDECPCYRDMKNSKGKSKCP